MENAKPFLFFPITKYNLNYHIVTAFETGAIRQLGLAYWKSGK